MTNDPDTYDLSDEPPPPRPPLRPASGAPVVAPEPSAATAAAPPILSYARPGTANTRGRDMAPADARGAAADPRLIRRERRRTFTVPIVLILLGTLVVFACGWGITGSFAVGAAWAGIGVAWDIVIILLGVLVGSRLVDLEGDTPGTLLLQIAAVVMATAAVFWPLMWLDNGAFCGALVAWIASTLVYCWLLSYFFDLEIQEVIILAIVIMVVRCVANLGWMSFFGSFGYLPM